MNSEDNTPYMLQHTSMPVRKKNLRIAGGVVLALLFVAAIAATGEEKAPATDTVKGSGPLRGISLVKTEEVRTGMGVKSLEMSADGSRIYSMNLEESTVFEFDRAARKITRKLVFVRHRGRGFNYDKKVWISSVQEKPVESHLTHNGRFLWISLHNGGGLVVWDLAGGDTYVPGRPYKEAWLHERKPASKPETDVKRKKKRKRRNLQEFSKKMKRLLFIPTGVTPKVITSTPDGRYLFVANWHSNNVSVLSIASDKPSSWRVVRNLATGRIPRGLLASPDSKYLYVAQMGGSGISIVDLASMRKVHEIRVGVNPRHIVLSNGLIYASLNIAGKLVAVDPGRRRVLRSAKTLPSPRTIALSDDGKLVIVVCYTKNYVQAFAADTMRELARWPSYNHPVGVVVHQNGERYEVWVCNYSSGTIKIFTCRANAG